MEATADAGTKSRGYVASGHSSIHKLQLSTNKLVGWQTFSFFTGAPPSSDDHRDKLHDRGCSTTFDNNTCNVNPEALSSQKTVGYVRSPNSEGEFPLLRCIPCNE